MRWQIPLLIVLILCGCSKKVVKPVEKRVSVQAAKVTAHTIPLQIAAVGHVAAFNSAEIKAQVEGQLMQVDYVQGEIAKEGALLCVIDPRPYQAQLEQAQAVYLQNDANLRFAKEKVERYGPLVKEEYVSQLDYDSYVTNAVALEAAVKQSLAEIETAQINLDYCYVRAPFTGMTSRKLVDVGNLITNAGQNLVLMNQIQPIYVDFSIPEKDLIKTLEKSKQHPLTVHVQPQGTSQIFEGEVIVIGNEVNQKTGMVSIRAQFANEKMLLWPGQFTKVHLILDQKPQALMVPESATLLGQKGWYAIVIDGQSVAQTRIVSVGEQIGGLIEVTKGLEAGDVIVTDGQLNIRPGSQVNITSIDTKFIQALDHESF